jgi:hypothetical protein
VIIGGPGDDVILGDVTVTNAPREWGVIKQVQGSVYLWGLTSGAAEPDSNPSDDTLYGGAGDNILVGWDGAKRARRPARCPHRRTIRERIASRTRMPLDPLPPPVGYRCGHSTVRSIMC